MTWIVFESVPTADSRREKDLLVVSNLKLGGPE